MELIQAVVLALIQGVTEFLPISSTAHLILVPELTSWPDQGLSFDVALNTATWLAVVIYFRSDITGLVRGFFGTLSGRGIRENPDGRLAWMVLVATIPVGMAGLLAHDIVAERLRTIEVIGVSSIFWGVVLWAADRRPGDTEVRDTGWLTAITAGVFQAISLIPGTSRSGITMTAGLFTGLTRTAAARFSFLLAVMVGGLAGAKEGVDMVRAGWDTPWLALSVGFAVAFVSSYFAIHYFLKMISRTSMTPFVVYRIALGVILLLLAL
ncbi:MAG TPA: undecaprenyl-diphosphate phosphatase [Thermodesulfobacteriota bacterium]|nr:undecaprenyl-diphosphate phosphatase [Thermodesulfobacteriota bacterium]